MLIGEDFDKIHISFFGLDITEPNVFLSDLLMGLTSLYCGWRLSKTSVKSPFRQWWLGFFFLYGISSIAGGFGHALFTYFGHTGKLFAWITGVFSVYLVERAMTEAHQNTVFKSKLKLFSLLKLVLVLLILFSILIFGPLDQKPGLPFLPVAINTIIGISWFAGFYAFQLSKVLQESFKYILIGVLIMLPSAFVFLLKINLHPWMDKNDISHLFLSAGIFCFMIGVENISSGSTLTGSTLK